MNTRYSLRELSGISIHTTNGGELLICFDHDLDMCVNYIMKSVFCSLFSLLIKCVFSTIYNLPVVLTAELSLGSSLRR